MNVKIQFDEWAENPRDEYDHVGNLWCWHRRYEFGSRKERRAVKNHSTYPEEAVVVLPVYLYDHSGIALSTSPFSCPWDSGQVGVIWADQKAVETHGGEEAVRKILEAEVKEYDQYASGGVLYGELLDDNGEVIDSIGGFYGTPEELEKELLNGSEEASR